MRKVAEELGATLDVRQDAPGFKRFTLTAGNDGVVADLVHERVSQLIQEKATVSTSPLSRSWAVEVESARRAAASRWK